MVQRRFKGKRKATLDVGQDVWLDGKNLHLSCPSKKLAPRRFGPLKIIDKVGTSSYWLQIPAQWKQNKVHDVFHEELLMPYKTMAQYGPLFKEPPPDVIDREEEYKVKEVLDA